MPVDRRRPPHAKFTKYSVNIMRRELEVSQVSEVGRTHIADGRRLATPRGHTPGMQN